MRRFFTKGGLGASQRLLTFLFLAGFSEAFWVGLGSR